MSKRTVSVQATVSFDFEIDDEAVSDWDGVKILKVVEKRKDYDPPAYTPEATQEQVLAHLGIQLAVHGRTMGNIDGWADFSADSAFGSPFGVYWDIDGVQVTPAPDAGAVRTREETEK